MRQNITLLQNDFLAAHQTVKVKKDLPYLNHARGILKVKQQYIVMNVMKNYYIIQFFFQKIFSYLKSLCNKEVSRKERRRKVKNYWVKESSYFMKQYH